MTAWWCVDVGGGMQGGMRQESGQEGVIREARQREVMGGNRRGRER